MNERIQQLAEQAGMVKILEEHASEYGAGTFENTPYPELEKFAELIVQECAACCGSQADMRNIRKRFGLTVESNIEYPGPETQGHHSQYNREYNFPK
jgi:hypothetical protein